MEDPVLSKVSSHSHKEDIATVERTEDDKSWMELSFVDDDGNNKSIADISAINTRPPNSVSLDALVIEDDVSLSSGDLNDTPKAAEPQKPVEEVKEKPASRMRPKKTKTHRKTKSFDDRILVDSKKKKKKKDKKSKGGSGDFSKSPKRKQRKGISLKKSTENSTDEALLDGEATSDDQSLVSNESSGASKTSKSSNRRAMRSLSPVRIRYPLRGAGLVRQLSGKAGGLIGRAKNLKDQLTMSDHVPGERQGMGKMLYSSFDDDDDDSDLDGDDFFS